ncbi:MAG: hypothetical protein H6937_13550 [Burkholderiales bacterium]|nr:hypothetical protein [Burkholderiales bacterium]
MSNLSLTNRIFYQLKPWIPRPVQIMLRRQIAAQRRKACQDTWPILPAAGELPKNWMGWPQQKKFAIILSHDVEWDRGQQRCIQLLQLEQSLGFRSAFNFVPERYQVSPDIRNYISSQGFEVAVHGLYHDGKLYSSLPVFQERAQKINRYLAEWGAVGFCAPSSHHVLEWNHILDIVYDSSTFDTDPFESQPDGVETIFPFWVENESKVGSNDGYVELPYTLAQDFYLFVVLQEKNNEVWKKKLDWIAERGGMALLITHPDYICFEDRRPGAEEYSVEHYADFLRYVQTQYAGQYWNALPREAAIFEKNRIQGSGYFSKPENDPVFV